MWGVYIPKFGKISVKFSVFWGPKPLSMHRRGEIWRAGKKIQNNYVITTDHS